MGQQFLIKAGAVLAAAFILAACSEDQPATDTSNAGDSSATTTAPSNTSNVSTAPAGPAPGTQEHFILNVGDRVFFGTDKHNLDAESQDVLRRQAAYLAENPSASIVIEGHADERGTREYNLGLGDRRATSARDYLVSLGVNSSRIRTLSYGKERPVAVGSNENAWAQNRRAVTVLGN